MGIRYSVLKTVITIAAMRFGKINPETIKSVYGEEKEYRKTVDPEVVFPYSFTQETPIIHEFGHAFDFTGETSGYYGLPPDDISSGNPTFMQHLEFSRQFIDLAKFSRLGTPNVFINQALQSLDSACKELHESGLHSVSLGNRFLKLSANLSKVGMTEEAELSKRIASEYFQ